MNRRQETVALLAALALAIALRLTPNLAWASWGSDSGEYIFLTQRLVDTGRISFDYEGWGIAYPYFPGMFILSGAFSASAGIDVVTAVKYVTPIFNGILVLGIFVIAHLITGDARTGIVAAAFAAVAMPLAFVTSHALPAGPGHVFVVATIATLVLSRSDRRFLLPLAVLSGALILTHHLSVYFLVGILLVSIVIRELVVRRPAIDRLSLETGFLVLFLVATFAYWFIFAPPLSGRIFSEATPVSPVFIAIGGILSVLLIPASVRLAPKLKASFSPRYPSPRRSAAIVGGTFAAGILLATSLAVFGLPGTTIVPEARWIYFYAPLVALVSFVPLGILVCRKTPLWWLPIGWLTALVVSVVFASVTNNHVLLPYRHADHMMEPIAILAALGFMACSNYLLKASRPGREKRTVGVLLAAGLVLFTGLNAAIAYPPQEALIGFQEGVTQGEWDAVLWAKDNIRLGTAMVADHRVSSLLFGIAHMNASWDAAKVTYATENTTEALNELRSLDIPAGKMRIDYVVLSDTMKKGVALVQWEPAKAMSPAAVRKFYEEAAFDVVYAQGDTTIFMVDWTKA
ncbi:MAG: hypothetical protein HY556_03480 [Euryarchaeota archaeon]|nr:hypothetical protein [Euryarchaeota archaeon]